jgi:hypothetical protein
MEDLLRVHVQQLRPLDVLDGIDPSRLTLWNMQLLCFRALLSRSSAVNPDRQRILALHNM